MKTKLQTPRVNILFENVKYPLPLRTETMSINNNIGSLCIQLNVLQMNNVTRI